jgi:hypothetical protein
MIKVPLGWRVYGHPEFDDDEAYKDEDIVQILSPSGICFDIGWYHGIYCGRVITGEDWVTPAEKHSTEDHDEIASWINQQIDRYRELDQVRLENNEMKSQLNDWNELFKAATMGGLPDDFKRLANVPPLFPNVWHQDCAAVAFTLKELIRKRCICIRADEL